MEQFQSQEEYLLLELTLPMVVTMVVSEAEIPVAPVSIVVSKQVYRMFYIHRVVSIFYTLKICDLCVDNRFQ